MKTEFWERVYQVVALIPYGRVTTYGSIAKLLGMASGARMVGYALRAGKDMDLPFHRVVNRNGELTGKMQFPTPSFMRELLEAEGISFIGDKIDMSLHFIDAEVFYL